MGLLLAATSGRSAFADRTEVGIEHRIDALETNINFLRKMLSEVYCGSHKGLF